MQPRNSPLSRQSRSPPRRRYESTRSGAACPPRDRLRGGRRGRAGPGREHPDQRGQFFGRRDAADDAEGGRDVGHDSQGNDDGRLCGHAPSRVRFAPMSITPHPLVADRYRLVEPLGQGGMGRVWKAHDEVLHREVAIKELVPPAGLTTEERQEMRERSLREARAIARLNHVNVVRIFDVLRTDGDPWIVMEYVPSRSLQDVLADEGPLPPARVAEIGLGMLGALRAA